MIEESAKCIIGNIPILEIPESTTFRRSKNSRSIKLSNKPSPSAVSMNVGGFKIQTLIGLGEHTGRRDGRWLAAFKALQVEQGFEVSKKDFVLARQTVSKYNKKAKSIFGSARTFVFERGINAQGEPDATVGRVGRLK